MTPSSVDLNDRKSIAKLDQSNMLGSIEALGKQIEHAWQETRAISIKPATPITQVVIAGMGGSGLGADVIKHLYTEQLTVPLDFIHGYSLPAYVNESTLVILSSYSGNTEEILECAKQAQAKKSTIACIAAGGELVALAKKHHWPLYEIKPTHNPSGQPRMAIGYSVIGTIGLCERAGVVSISQSEFDTTTELISNLCHEYAVEITQDQNFAKLLAFTMFNKQTVLIAPDFLEGAIHVAANQSNENGKTFTTYFVIPEMNHHLLESLRYPNSLQDTHVVLFFQTLLANSNNQIRVNLSQQIFEDHEIETMLIALKGDTKLAQVFELITMMAFATFYQCMLEGINPSPIPIVESFKEMMKKQTS
jgi:glucose/mannose-6-phosphate isomerase